MYNTFKKKLDDIEKEIKENYDYFNETNQTIRSDMRIQSIYLSLNNSQNFKTFLENYYKLLKECSYSFLFDDKHKTSYDHTIELIIDSIKGKNGTNSDKIVEKSETTDYKKYNDSEWNWFLINNVIHQMFYNNDNDDIQLNENFVSKTLEKIYILKPDFKTNFKSELERAKFDIIFYVYVFNLGYIIKAIKIYIS